MKNTGKPSETAFESRLTALGKSAYFYRIKDAAAIRGLTGRVGHVDEAPADYIVVMNNQMEYAEVKSTQNPNCFPFSLLKRGQNSHGIRVLTAGGIYHVYIHNLLTDTWYRVPLFVINAMKGSGKASAKWQELERFIWQ